MSVLAVAVIVNDRATHIRPRAGFMTWCDRSPNNAGGSNTGGGRYGNTSRTVDTPGSQQRHGHGQSDMDKCRRSKISQTPLPWGNNVRQAKWAWGPMSSSREKAT